MVKEENDNQNKCDEKNEKNGFFSKLGGNVKKFAGRVKDALVETTEKIKTNIEDKKQEKIIEQSIQNKFEENAVVLFLISLDKKNKTKKYEVKVVIDYDQKLIKLYNARKGITIDDFFVDKYNQKYAIKLIRQNQKENLEVDKIEYTREIVVIEYEIVNDYRTKEEMKTIINNSITITDSTINKSDIG